MGIFGKGKGGGLMNVIRCDEPEYLVWKWRPEGQEANSPTRENSIRYGSSLRVKDGEVAVFVYKQKEGPMQDFIVGPYDETIKTANFPVLASIVGMAFGGESPFQAEVYFINMASIIQVKFTVPYFDVQDPRFPDMSIPVAAGGTISFKIDDYKEFIKVNRLINFTLDDFKKQIKDTVVRRVKGTLANVLYQLNMPLAQIERNIEAIGDAIKDKLKADLEDFGVALRRLDLSRIEPDKEHQNWQRLQQVTADYAIRSTAANQDIALETAKMQSQMNLKNMQDMQAINAENMQETLRVQREEMQRAQRMQTESANIGAFTIEKQAEVLSKSAESLGQMSSMSFGGGDGSSFNPAAMMTGMAMGGSVAQQMSNMMGNINMGATGQQPPAGSMPPMPGMPPVPPVAPTLSAMPEWMIVSNGQQAGPLSAAQLQTLVQGGQFTAQTLVWKQGMPAWTPAGQLPELQPLFAPAMHPAPPVPPVPGGMPPVPTL